VEGPWRPKFERLTRQEERAGLLDETASIGTRDGWAERLRERGYTLRGHRLVLSRRSTAAIPSTDGMNCMDEEAATQTPRDP
jgi:hypothetical protein